MHLHFFSFFFINNGKLKGIMKKNLLHQLFALIESKNEREKQGKFSKRSFKWIWKFLQELYFWLSQITVKKYNSHF
ncbi:hypothetical protein BpHYR1_052640 [Brachionus plicatilis]|uniref:Uncharacterized protein n=1 Tax=Brachionus plicatilis TaxID=10195 RepID=A0A3M7S9C3_BRAPC|nr:hypothetical protein BpHYR1_052640 [Brachionus plicatilis]